MSPKGIHLNSRRCNLRWTDLTITTLKGADIHGKKQCSAPTGLDRIVPEFHGLHPRLFMVQPAGQNSSTRKPIENVEEPVGTPVPTCFHFGTWLHSKNSIWRATTTKASKGMGMPPVHPIFIRGDGASTSPATEYGM